MAHDEVFHDRRVALEEEFFKKKNQELLEKLKAAETTAHEKSTIERVTGIQDTAVIDAFLGLQLNAQSLAALTLYPLVAVAWADGEVSAAERAAVLQVAGKRGMQKGSVAQHLLEMWLDTKPPASLKNAWLEYIRSLCAKLSEKDRNTLKNNVIDRAMQIAEASGGIMGLASVSRLEKETLDELSRAFAE